MGFTSFPFDRLVFGNEHWMSDRAIDEIEIYSDILEDLQKKRDSLANPGKDEDVTLTSVQAVIGAYAIEIAIKSLWALDNSSQEVPHSHDLLNLFDDLSDDTKGDLRQLEFTRELVKRFPRPFVTNRYSMECRNRTVTIYSPIFLRTVANMLRDKVEKVRADLMNQPASGRSRRTRGSVEHVAPSSLV